MEMQIYSLMSFHFISDVRLDGNNSPWNEIGIYRGEIFDSIIFYSIGYVPTAWILLCHPVVGAINTFDGPRPEAEIAKAITRWRDPIAFLQQKVHRHYILCISRKFDIRHVLRNGVIEILGMEQPDSTL
jgi:hypothetical protein